MKDVLLFFLFLPAYVAALVGSAVLIAVLLAFAVVYIPSRMLWALATGDTNLGPGW